MYRLQFKDTHNPTGYNKQKACKFYTNQEIKMKLNELYGQLAHLILHGHGDLEVCVFDSHNEAHYEVKRWAVEEKEYMFPAGKKGPEIVVALYD
jgi:hypothetical protein